MTEEFRDKAIKVLETIPHLSVADFCDEEFRDAYDKVTESIMKLISEYPDEDHVTILDEIAAEKGYKKAANIFRRLGK